MTRPILSLTLFLPLLACSTASRNFATSGTGGASSSDSTSSKATGTGAGGGSNAGCDLSGNAFDVMSTTDIGAYKLHGRLYLVPQVLSGRGYVHVVAYDEGDQGVLIRTLVNDTSPNQNLVNFVPVNPVNPTVGGYFGTDGARLSGTSLQLLGHGDQGISQVVFPVDPNTGVNNTPTITPIGTGSASSCPTQNYRQFAFSVGTDEKIHYVGVCDNGDGTGVLFVGNPDGSTVTAYTGALTDTQLNLKSYAFVGSTHVVTFDAAGSAPFFSFGTNPAGLGANLKPFVINPDPGALNGLFGLVPTVADDGIVVIAGQLPANLTNGALWAGSVSVAKLGTLTNVPPPLKKVATLASSTDVGPPFNPPSDENHIYAAGATLDLHSVRFTLLNRDGTPVIVQLEVVKDTSVDIIAAAAAPLGTFDDVVVWIQQTTDGAGNTVQTVRGQRLLCHGG